MIAAILQAQWRSMRTFRRGGFSVSTAFSWLSGFLFYGFWCMVAFGAQAFFKNPDNSAYFAPVLSSGLLFMLLYWQITPIITASMGASLDLKKLLAYPIPHPKLFAIELLLRVTTCIEMPIVLLGAVIGLLRNPYIHGAPAMLLAALVFLALNLFLTAALRNALDHLLRRKRAKELIMFLMVALSILPQFLLAKRVHPKDFGKWLPDLPYLPWTATSRIMLGMDLAIPALALAFFLVLVYLFARQQFEAGLRFDGEQSKVRQTSSTAGSSRWESLYNWPARFLPDPTAAIMEKEFRTCFRTPQFRFILMMGAAFGLILYIPMRMRGGPAQSTVMSENILAFASVYAVLMLGNVSYFNSFGFERSAVQAWYSYPVQFRTTVIAKNLAAVCFILMELVLVTLVALVFRFKITPEKLVESVLVALICALYLIAIGNIASVRLSHPMNPERISQGGSSKAKNAIILAAFPILVLPVGLAYWARSVFGSPLAFFGMLAFAAAFGSVLYYIGLDTTVRIGNERRETIITDLSRGDGPVSST